jgi:hypothetical protein
MPPSPPVSSGEPRQGGLPSAGRTVLPLVPGAPPRQARPRPARPRPLPDAAAVRLSAVPDSAPPYDDDGRPAARSRKTGPGKTGSAGASSQKPGPDRPGPDRPATGQRRPDPAAWPSQFAQVLAETLAGARPRGQIRPWTTDQALRRIRQLGPLLSARADGVQPRVRRIVTSRPAAGVVEMTVIVSVGSSIRALAVRLERDGDQPAEHDHRPGEHAHTPRAAGWICTAIEAA